MALQHEHSLFRQLSDHQYNHLNADEDTVLLAIFPPIVKRYKTSVNEIPHLASPAQFLQIHDTFQQCSDQLAQVN